MEPTPAKSSKKRRRWLVVAIVLVLVSLLTWWHWPRSDARFVGKWADTTADSQSTLWLGSNGIGRVEDRSFKTAFQWRLSDKVLTLGAPSQGVLFRTLAPAIKYVLSLSSDNMAS